MFEGYLTFGGTEIANSERVAAYVRNVFPQFPLRNCTPAPTLNRALGDKAYTSPLVDEASWIDPNDESTYEFYGFYPLSIEGIQNSTQTATTTESVGDGGYNSVPRRSSKEIRVSGLLIARDGLALDAGMSWLSEALSGQGCSGGDCNGQTLCYLIDAPDIITCYGTHNAPVTELFRQVAPGGGRSIGLPAQGEREVSGVFSPDIQVDGFTWAYGVASRSSGLDVESYGPVTPQRTNVLLNPRFANNTASWSVTNGTVTRSAAGASDGGAMATVTASGTSSLRTSLTDAPFGTVQVTADLASAANALVTVRVRLNSDNSVVASQTFQLTSAWARVQLTTAFARDTYLEFSSSATYQVSRVMAEGNTQIDDYFDGSTQSSGRYANSWLGAPGNSASRRVWTGTASYSYCGDDFYSWVEGVRGVGNVKHVVSWAEEVPATEQAVKYERHLNDVVCIDGPKVRKTIKPRGGGQAYQVEFILSAATPFAYSTPKELLDLTSVTQLAGKQTWIDLVKPADPISVIIDPNCPPIPAAPRPPAIKNACIDGPGVWDRYHYVLTAEQVSVWRTMLPTIEFASAAQDYRQIRVRFTPNPFSWPTPTSTTRFNRAYNPSAALSTAAWSAVNGQLTRVTAIPGVAANTVPRQTGVRVQSLSTNTMSASLGTPGSTGSRSYVLGTQSGVVTLSAYAVATVTSGWTVSATFYNSSGLVVGSTTTSANQSVPANTTTRLSLANVTIPATAQSVIMTVTSSGTYASGQSLYLMGVFIDGATTVGTYFDGDTPASGGFYYGWENATDKLGRTGRVQSPVDPFSYCSEFIVSYLPQNATLSIDGEVRRAEATVAGALPIPAGNLLYASDGGPMTWPELSCGTPYLMTVDVPEGTGNALSMALSLTRR